VTKSLVGGLRDVLDQVVIGLKFAEEDNLVLQENYRTLNFKLEI